MDATGKEFTSVLGDSGRRCYYVFKRADLEVTRQAAVQKSENIANGWTGRKANRPVCIKWNEIT